MKQLKEIIKNKTRSKQEWLIENLIPKGEIIILYAPSNHYKTAVSTKIALEIATGSQDLGVTEIGKVLIFSPDCSEPRLRARIDAMTNQVYSTKKSDILGNLYINWDDDLDITADSYGLIEDDYIETYIDNYGNEQVRESEVLVGKKWNEQWDLGDFKVDHPIQGGGDCKNAYNVLIIIDTLSKVIGANSTNDDKAMRVAINNLSEIIQCMEYAKVSILVLAHASYKSPSKGIMGSATQGNDVTTVLRIKKKKKYIGEIIREKFKGSTEGTSIPFKIREAVIDGVETIYADIGSELGEWERVILNFYDEGLDADNIKDNTYEILGQQYKSKKSFNVVYGRKLKSLIKMGFIKDGNKNKDTES
jgi:hypothetical protein